MYYLYSKNVMDKFKECDREYLIARLQDEVSLSYEMLREGKGMSLEEARKLFNYKNNFLLF